MRLIQRLHTHTLGILGLHPGPDAPRNPAKFSVSTDQTRARDCAALTFTYHSWYYKYSLMLTVVPMFDDGAYHRYMELLYRVSCPAAKKVERVLGSPVASSRWDATFA